MVRETAEADRIEVSDVRFWDGVQTCMEMRCEPRYMLRVDEQMVQEIADRLKKSGFKVHFVSRNHLRDGVFDIEFSDR